jgi:hypothetical protein
MFNKKEKAILVQITELSRMSQFFYHKEQFIGKLIWVKNLTRTMSDASFSSGWVNPLSKTLKEKFFPGKPYDHGIYGFRYKVVGTK